MTRKLLLVGKIHIKRLLLGTVFFFLRRLITVGTLFCVIPIRSVSFFDTNLEWEAFDELAWNDPNM